MTKFAAMIRAFSREEDGLAMTEYLILLGLLTAGVITAITVVGTELDTAWTSWGVWFGATDLTAP